MTCWTWHVGQKDLVCISRLLASSYTTRQQHVRTTTWSSRTFLRWSWALVVLPGFVLKGVVVAWTTVVATVVAAYNDVISALVVWRALIHNLFYAPRLEDIFLRGSIELFSDFLALKNVKCRRPQVSLLAVFPSASLLANTIAPQSSGDQCNIFTCEWGTVI